MFSLFSGLYETYFAPVKLNVLIVGPSDVGKTTLLERLKVTSTSTPSSKQMTSWSNLSPLPPTSLIPNKYGAKQQQQGDHELEKDTQQQQDQEGRFWKCPSSKRYQYDASCDDDEAVIQAGEETKSLVDNSEPNDSNDTATTTATTDQEGGGSNENENDITTQQNMQEQQEVDLKANAHMLPMEKIRPTMGMNLGKVELCGTFCNIWDVGGKMEVIWERYYKDCDAVIFVWKIGEKLQEETADGDDDSDDDDEKEKTYTFDEMEKILEKVRNSIPDDIPFVVLGHIYPTKRRSSFSSSNLYLSKYDTSSILPHYHNPLTALFFVNASTGHGVRNAMEWLIPLAKKEYKLRISRLSNENINSGMVQQPP